VSLRLGRARDRENNCHEREKNFKSARHYRFFFPNTRQPTRIARWAYTNPTAIPYHETEWANPPGNNDQRQHVSKEKIDVKLERVQYLKSQIGGSEMAPAVNPAPDGSRLKTKVIADPNETAGVPIRRQEPSARTFFQECFRRGEIIERLMDDG